jgi:hypothetical protein
VKVGDLVKIKGGSKIGVPTGTIGLIVKHYFLMYDEVHTLYKVQLCGIDRCIQRFGEDLEALKKK